MMQHPWGITTPGSERAEQSPGLAGNIANHAASKVSQAVVSGLVAEHIT